MGVAKATDTWKKIGRSKKKIKIGIVQQSKSISYYMYMQDINQFKILCFPNLWVIVILLYATLRLLLRTISLNLYCKYCHCHGTSYELSC